MSENQKTKMRLIGLWLSPEEINRLEFLVLRFKDLGFTNSMSRQNAIRILINRKYEIEVKSDLEKQKLPEDNV